MSKKQKLMLWTRMTIMVIVLGVFFGASALLPTVSAATDVARVAPTVENGKVILSVIVAFFVCVIAVAIAINNIRMKNSNTPKKWGAQRQIWRELFEKTKTDKIMWRHTGSESGCKEFMTFETEIDGKKFTLCLKLISCAGGGDAAMSFEHIFLANEDRTIEMHETLCVFCFFVRTTAGKLYNNLRKQVIQHRKKEGHKNFKNVLENINPV